MKRYLSAALALVCAVLVIALVMVKSGDNAQHESDAGAIDGFSNRLDSAQSQLALYEGRLVTCSNSLDESQSALLTSSNQLIAAESTVALDTEQITNLSQQIAAMTLQNQTLGRSLMDLTNQMTIQVAALTKQIALTEAGLDQANKDYALLENRFRIDVAERVVMQRKFYNLPELKAQMQRLKDDPFVLEISARSIYAGLDVEVKSNTFHVISPN